MDHLESCALVVVENLSYKYGSVQVLDSVSFSLFGGEIAVLIGRNGAGKTTLLRCLAGWNKVKTGDVQIGQVSVFANEREARSQVVFVPDTPVFYDELTAWEHLQLVAQLHQVDAWQPRAEYLLDRLALSTQCDTYPFTFSQGMRYKLALCMALLLKPRLLLLDEPFGPLDPQAAVDLWAELDAQRASGMAVLLSSHGLPGGTSPDRYLVMDQGTIITQFTQSQLSHNPDVQQSVLSVMQQAFVEQA